MKVRYMGILLILTVDACGLLESIQVPDSEQNIMNILDCNCLRFCSKIANDDYMGNNVEAYR